MPLDFGRAPGVAEVIIDRDKCTVCGLCARVCNGGPLYVDGGQVCVDQTRLFGCIACGQCVAVCPNECISVSGRDMLPSDALDLPPSVARAGFDQLRSLMLSRRSVREYQDREIEPDIIDKIIDAASTSPMGFPPSEVGVIVFAGREKVVEFKDDLMGAIRSSKWMLSPLGLTLMRPFLGKEGTEAMRSFVGPVVDMYTSGEKKGEDWFFYGAPLALYFHGSPYADPADPIIAATYAMLAAESLGLGSCMLGFPPWLVKSSKRLKAKYGLPARMQPGLVVAFGYPAVKYRRAIKRRFASVREWTGE